MTKTTRFKAFVLATAFLVFAFLTFATQPLKAQNKLLTIDDIFDPDKKVNFSGSTPTIRWLKDGNYYLLTNGQQTRSAATAKDECGDR